jgi:AmmeMemoRadiSam system protein B/AmmeMemoRadiSam system protein A
MKARITRSTLALALGLAACAQQRSSTAVPDAAPPRAERPLVASAPPAAEPTTVHYKRVRRAALAGSWYPAERSLILAEIQRMLRATGAAPSLPEKPLALVVPHAGWRYSGEAAMAVLRSLRPGDFARVVLVGPAHRSAFSGFSLSDVEAYRTPLGDVPLCPEAGELRDGDLIRAVPGADTEEHSLEIELPLLQNRLGAFCLVPILVGSTTPSSEQEFATRLGRLHDGKTLFVFSSDFVHYGPRFDYVPFGPSAIAAHDRIMALERQAITLLTQKDAPLFRKLLDSTGATICGRHGLSALLEFLAKRAPRAEAVLVAHYGSSELDPAREDNSVGYVALAYLENPPTRGPQGKPMAVPPRPAVASPSAPPFPRELGDRLVRIARATLSSELGGSADPGSGDLARELESIPQQSELDRVQAAFVTLTKSGQLRGCVGQIEPVYWLPEAVVHAALDAALHDTRFQPVMANELGELEVEVTVLSPPHPVGSWQEIVLGQHGVVLEKDQRRALFLPQVAEEQGWTRPEMLRALSRKAGLSPDAWRARDAKFSVFTGQEFREHSRRGQTPGQRGAR